MQLIDEIESAPQTSLAGRDAHAIMGTVWWDRIRDALLAGADVVLYLADEHGTLTTDGESNPNYEPECPLCQAVDRYRAATEGER